MRKKKSERRGEEARMHRTSEAATTSFKKVVCILHRWLAVAGKSPLKRSGRRISPPSRSSLFLHGVFPSAFLPDSSHMRAPKSGLRKKKEESTLGIFLVGTSRENSLALNWTGSTDVGKDPRSRVSRCESSRSMRIDFIIFPSADFHSRTGEISEAADYSAS